MRRISSTRKKALRTGMSFVLTFAMALGSIPTDGIAYAAITNGVKTSQTETKVETTETPATTPATTPTVGVAVDANVSTTDEAKPKTVTVRFDANGGEGRMDDFEVTLDNSDWSVAETPFTRDGYRFVGWSITANVDKDAVDDPETDIDESLTGVVLADRQEFVDLVSQRRDEDGNVVETHDFGKYVSDDVLTLYAQWEKIETDEVSAPVVEENEVVGNDEVVEDTSVGKDDVIDARSDKELDQELLSGALGGKTDGGVADKIGTSNPLLRKLTAPLMAAAVPSLKAQSTPDGSREGTAYAVLDSAGTLTFFRSDNTYTAGTGQTVTDVMGNTYTGQVYTGVETNAGTSYSSAPWYNQRMSIKLARIADGQVIAPKSCVGWFYYCSNMTAFEGAERLDISKVTNMNSMFCDCRSMTEPPAVGGWDTSAVTYMGYMFYDCRSMTEPPAVGGWDTSAVTNMGSMFDGCSKMPSLDVSGWDFSKVTRSSNRLGLQNCSALKELKVPAGAKLAGLPEHSAQGDYAATWGNADRGITGSTAANLMSVVNAGNGAGTWTWEKLDPRAGTAYAVLDSAGTLTFFRSTNTYTAGPGKTVNDIAGNTYTGQVYTGIETNKGGYSTPAPWYDQRMSIKLARIADGQVIAPESCVNWFSGCSSMTAFDGAARLDTSAVTNMYSMFCNCSSMTKPPAVGGWRTSAVTNMDSMFLGCSSMTEPPAVGNWNTSKVTYMDSMFSGCSSMTVPPAVGSWDTNAVTNMGGMFSGCSSMTVPPAVGGWDTSAVTDMGGMFSGCEAMTEPPAVGNWDTSAVTSMNHMFSGCEAMTEPPSVGSWRTSKVTNMGNMFNNCSKMLSLDVSGWDFSKITRSSKYGLGLQGCLALKELKVPAGAKIAGLPEHAAQGGCAETWGNAERGVTGSTAANMVTTINAGNGAGTWKWELDPRSGTAYAVLDSAGTLTLFRSTNTYTAGTGKTVTDIMGNTYTGQVYTGIETYTSAQAPWYNQRMRIKLARIADGQVIAPVSCARWFYACSNMTAFEDAERLDTSAVTNMDHMFNGCKAMTEPPAVGGWDTSAVTDMGGMFVNCSSMTEPPSVGSWDTSAVTNMGVMFNGCKAMTVPPAVGGWDTGAVTNMGGMFNGCEAMTEPPSVGSWRTSAVTNMKSMFSGCKAMTEPPAVGGWNTSAAPSMYNMFNNCSKMLSLDVSGWDFSKITSSSNYLGLRNCLALKELKVPAGAKIAGLPEHAAQGDYAATWGNADRGVTGATAAALVQAVNAGNGAGTWTWDKAAAEWQDPGQDITVDTDNTDHDNGTYLVTIPTKIAYENMNIGKVDTSDSYTVNVRGAIKDGQTVTVTAESGNKLKNGAFEDITETTTQGKTTWTAAEVFNKLNADGSVAGTDTTDTIAMKGEVKSAGKYEGVVGYSAKLA